VSFAFPKAETNWSQDFRKACQHIFGALFFLTEVLTSFQPITCTPEREVIANSCGHHPPEKPGRKLENLLAT